MQSCVAEIHRQGPSQARLLRTAEIVGPGCCTTRGRLTAMLRSETALPLQAKCFLDSCAWVILAWASAPTFAFTEGAKMPALVDFPVTAAPTGGGRFASDSVANLARIYPACLNDTRQTGCRLNSYIWVSLDSPAAKPCRRRCQTGSFTSKDDPLMI